MSANAAKRRFRVEGMDCAACAEKIENAMRRMPGVSDVSVNYGTETLSLVLDEDRNSTAAIETTIARLGYRTAPGEGLLSRPNARSTSPLASRKIGLVVVSGILLAAAFAISAFRPEWARWAYLAVALIGLAPIARRAISAGISGTPFTIETLMTVAAIGAAAIGAEEEAAVFIFLFVVGELLEGLAARSARSGIAALVDLVPRTANRIRSDGTETLPVAELAIGDIVLVRPGERIPSDGYVVEGQSEVSEAPVTGESVPVPKLPGARVYAGSINANAELRVAVDHTAADNTIARIVHMVEEAQASKSPTARFIEDFSRWYTPAAMAISAAVIVLPPLIFHGDWLTWVYRGLAVLLIACPCALVISTPAAIASGLTHAARRGLLIKGGAALEAIGKAATVAFDKTGTLTLGALQVTDVMAFSTDDNDVITKVAAVESGSTHPLALAITAEAKRRGIEIPRSYGGQAIPGKGVSARLKSGFVIVASPRYAAEEVELDQQITERIAALESEGKTTVVVLEGKKVTGLIAARDEPRSDARLAVEALRQMGLRTVMLTGDNRRTAAAIAGAIGIDAEAEMLPDDKLRRIAELKTDGPVLMVGDGINDAPALAAASVGIAMGGGTDVALETADAALMRNEVGGITELVRLSRATLVNIHQNVTIALGLKLVFLATTLTGTTSLWMAILADTGATVLVTANALRLSRFRA